VIHAHHAHGDDQARSRRWRRLVGALDRLIQSLACASADASPADVEVIEEARGLGLIRFRWDSFGPEFSRQAPRLDDTEDAAA